MAEVPTPPPNPFTQLAKNPKNFGRLVAIIGAIGFVGYAATNSLYTVQGGERAVIFNRVVGVKNKIYAEGMHFMIPWFDRPEIYSIRAKAHKLPAETPSKDLQVISITVRVLLKPMPEELPNIYRKLGKDYDEKVLKSLGPETVKSTVAQFNAAELVTQREEVSKLMRKRLAERAKDFWINVDDVSIIDLNFGPDYLAAVEAKQVAQQEAERARYLVERARQSKLEIIVKAEGEAQAARKFNEQLKQDPEGTFLELRRIEAAKEIARVVASSPNRLFINADNLMFDILSEQRKRDESEDAKK
eukprot:TRINITY_DN18397_c0_g1_i1.p1 TRINITY_DN18397_c0_g1~~TRINITY_DN18397_c0_g1_i1.p1  ORF type:complete len:302 (+),score=76.27 TRINITY_DN18397_c0_g1_i1:30-935(+)